MKPLFICRFIPVLGAVLLVTAQVLLGSVTGSILGTVRDSSGAVVPGARVIVRNSSTGLTRRTVTNSTGGYEFLDLPVGSHYSVEVQASGFSRMVQTGITLLVNQKYRADFRLAVGAVSQIVRVTAQQTQVETTSTQLGDVISDRKMETLPLNGRSYIDLLGLQAGVAPMTSSVAATNSISGNLSSGNVSINGQREAANEFLVNGSDVMNSFSNGAAVVPVLDAIQEFRILTSSFDAEYGMFSGGIVNVITKSGTNAFHGDVFEFLRNDAFDSRNFFDLDQTNIVTGQPEPGTARGAFKQNQFGFTFGGPILKNRLFFFSDYQGTRLLQGISTGNISVPSSLERQGNFSDASAIGYSPLTGFVRGCSTSGAGCMNQVLSQRLGYTVNPGEPYWIAGCDTATQAAKGVCVFPGQVIPVSAWSPAAKEILKFFPQADVIADNKPYFTSAGSNSSLRDDKFGNRIDLDSHRAGNWSFYQNFDDTSLISPFTAIANVPGFSESNPSRAQQFNLSNAYILSPSAVNEVRLNFTRSAFTTGQPIGGLGPIGSFGFETSGLGIIPGDSHLSGLPEISLSQLGITMGASQRDAQYDNVWHASDNFSKISGLHTLKFGGEFRYIQYNVRVDNGTNGEFTFSGSETGNDFADYLIGAPDTYIQGAPSVANNRTHYGAAYAQDSFKIKPNLTVNYGLRYEVSQPWYDARDEIQAFDPAVQSVKFPNAPRGWVFPGDPGIPRTLSPTRWHNFAPRTGVAYSPGFSDGPLRKIFGGPGKTSIRAAYGIFYTSVEEEPLFFELGDVPFGLFYNSPALVYLEQPFKARASSNNPGQRFPFVPLPGTGSDGSFASYLPISGSTTTKIDNVLPYAEEYNFTVQRQISPSTVLTAGYLGNQAHHLMTQIEANPGIASLCMQVRAIYIGQGNLGGACGPFGEDTIYPLGNGRTVYGTRPYSVTSGRYLSQGLLDFGGTLPYAATLANSTYNSLQITLQKSAGPLNFLAAYTWSKSLDNSSGFNEATNPYDQRISKSLSAYDIPQNFVISYSYDLPLLKLAHAPRGALAKLIGGWQIVGITRFNSGFPVALSQSGDLSLCGCFGSALNGVDLPNYDGKTIEFSNPRSTNSHQFFSPAPFSSEQLGVGGNANRLFFNGPGLNNWDFALHKLTRISERTSIEFRAEFFNIFNHAQFENPVGDFASSQFGQVTAAAAPRIGQLALKVYF
jgi:hypothetical protein